MLKCEKCGFESDNLDEVSYYDINGYRVLNEYDIEINSQNPNALAHILCEDCADEMDW